MRLLRFQLFISKGLVAALTFSIVSTGSSSATPAAAITCPALRSVTGNIQAFTIDTQGNLYALEGGGNNGGGSEVNLIQKIDRTTGTTTLIAGGWQRNLPDGKQIGLPGFYGDGGPAVDAGIWYPIGMGTDSTGNIYISDYGLFHVNANRIGFIDNYHSNRIRKISTDGIINTVGGSGDFAYTGDGGLATSATLRGPRALAVSSAGDVYFVDSENFVIRKINHTNGVISTIAGTGVQASVLETGTATSAKLGSLNSLALDSVGNLYFADDQFNVIGKITLTSGSPQISVVGGNNAPAPNDKSILGEGSLATATSLRGPSAIAFDSHDNIYYLDNYGWALRKISTSDRKITTLAGTGEWDTPVSKPTGGSALIQNISSGAVVVDSDGKVILSDRAYIAVYNPINQSLSYLSGGYPNTNDDSQKLSPFCGQSSVSAGSTPNSQVATIPSGAVVATIPATTSLPATTLNFGGTVPTSVTVVPITTNPAAVSATPFTISGSTKIVDIQINGDFGGSVTVCLDGAETDHLYHYTGTPAAWVELPSRTYANGQVCGVTTSFSPFAAAPPATVSVVASSPASDAAAKAAAEAAAAKREAEKQAARVDITSKLKSAKDLSVESFAKAEIPGITPTNIAAVQAELLGLPEASRTDINQVLKIAHKFEVVGNIGSDQVNYMQSNSFIEIGLIPQTSKNKVALVAAVRKLPESARDTYGEIKAIIDAETAKLKARSDRLAAIISRNASRSTR